MLPLAENSQVDIYRIHPHGFGLQSREWVGRGDGACAQFEDGAVSVCTDHSSLSVAGKYGVLTVDAQGCYSYALHKSIGSGSGIGAGRDAFVYVGEEPCVYVLEPLWFATEVFHINNNPTGRAESHQVVVSIAVR